MTFLILGGLIVTATLVLGLDPFDLDEEASTLAGPENTSPPTPSEPATHENATNSDPDPFPFIGEEAANSGDTPPAGQGDIEEPADTGASILETAQGLFLERGDDENRSFLAIRVLETAIGPLSGERTETSWVDVYLVPAGNGSALNPDNWKTAVPYDEQAEAFGLEHVGHYALGRAALDLMDYTSSGTEPDFTDTRIRAPDISANATIAMLAVDGSATTDGLEITAARETDTLDPVIPGEALAWRITQTTNASDWEFSLSRASSHLDGTEGDDTILLAPFETANISLSGGNGTDTIATGIGPDINGGAGADNIILTLPAYTPVNNADPWPRVTDIAFADAADSLAVILPTTSAGPVFAIELSEISGGNGASAVEYSRVLVQAEPEIPTLPPEAALQTLLRDGAADGLRILARIQLGAELVTQNGDGSTSVFGIRNQSPDISYVGTLAGTATLTLPAALA